MHSIIDLIPSISPDMCTIYVHIKLTMNRFLLILILSSIFQYNVITGLSNVDTADGLKTNMEIMVPDTSLPSGCS